MNIHHKPASYNDLDLIYDIQCRSFKSDFHESREIFESILNKYPKGCFIIYKDDKVAGYLITHPDYLNRENYEDKKLIDGHEDALFIHDLCIDPAFQNNGIAKHSVKFIEQFAAQNNFQTILGIAIQQAQEFWIKQGFTMGQSHPYCGENAKLMRKNIG